jgi:hypothetical protein
MNINAILRKKNLRGRDSAAHKQFGMRLKRL